MSGNHKKISRSFYNRNTLTVSKELLGKYLIYKSKDSMLSSRIVEVEAYVGEGDPACHASHGITKRNAQMFDKAGYSYIYFIYGMYHCLNFVTEKKGFPAAVLVRACEAVEGIESMRGNSVKKRDEKLLAGPGLLCKCYDLTRDQNGLDLTGDCLYLEDRNEDSVDIGTSSRIGISKGKDLEWRFFDKNSLSLSTK